jgi:hypothetical protein
VERGAMSRRRWSGAQVRMGCEREWQKREKKRSMRIDGNGENDKNVARKRRDNEEDGSDWTGLCPSGNWRGEAKRENGRRIIRKRAQNSDLIHTSGTHFLFPAPSPHQHIHGPTPTISSTRSRVHVPGPDHAQKPNSHPLKVLNLS